MEKKRAVHSQMEPKANRQHRGEGVFAEYDKGVAWFALVNENMFSGRVWMTSETVRNLGKFVKEVERDEREKRPLR